MNATTRWISSVTGIALITICATTAWAQTSVQGVINTNAVWTTSGSPYMIMGDVTVAPHVTLTIQEGTEIRVATTDAQEAGVDTNRVEFVVRGSLVATGSASAPVTFQSTSEDRNQWFGVVFAPDARPSSLQHVRIEGADIGIWARHHEELVIEDVELVRVETGVRWDGDAPLMLDRVTFRAFRTGLRTSESGEPIDVHLRETRFLRGDREGVAIDLSGRTNALVERVDVLGAGLGLRLRSGGSLDLQNSVFAGNAQGGLSLAQGASAEIHIRNNTLDSNVFNLEDRETPGVGIDVTSVTSAGDFIIRNNSITRHGTAGLRVAAGPSPVVSTNNAWSNGANYQGVSAGVGAISVNPLYRRIMSYETELLDANWSTSINNQIRTYESAVAHRFRAHLLVRRRDINCDSRVNAFWREMGVQRTYFVGGSGSPTTAYNDWTPYSYNGSVDLRYNRTTTTYCNTSTNVLANDIEWSYPNTTDVNFRVEPSSALIDAGSPLSAPDVDRDGSPRPHDGNVDGEARVDIGAYEWRDNFPPVAVAGPNHVILPGTEITFDGRASFDPDGVIVRHTWSFGPGDSVDAAVVTRTFNTLGAFDVTLTVEDDRGETHTATVRVTVADNLPPISRPGADRFVAVGETITFDGSLSSDPDGAIELYQWDFGDDTPGGSGAVVTHAYARAGVYEVTLTVTDNRGAEDSASLYVVVGGAGGPVDPVVPPTARISLPISGLAGAAISLSGADSVAGDAAITSYSWDFGDGQTGSGATLSHTWDTPGSYLVRLTVVDAAGELDTDFAVAQISASTTPPSVGPTADAGGPYATILGNPIQFSAAGSNAGDAPIASWSWDFGDGNTGEGETVSHTYAATGGWLVRLTVTDENGLTSSSVLIANVRSADGTDPEPLRPPVANAGPDRRVGIGEDVTFDGSASSSPNGTIVSWHWNFGDGSTAEGVEVTHAWSEPGVWLVRLTVTDSAGLSSETLVGVQVGGATSPDPSVRAPVAVAGPSRVVTLGDAVTFDGGSSIPGDAPIDQWSWEFGDGNTGEGETYTHTYLEAGLWIVRLTVTDENDASAWDLTTVVVRDPASTDPDPDPDQGPAPIAVAGDDVAVNAGDAVVFSAAASTVRDPLEATFAWDFGDGNTGEGLSERHTWDEGGLYTVTLTIRDDLGRVAVDTLVADVNALPIADAGGDRVAVVGQSLTLDAGLSHDPDGTITSWAWRFGDGNTGEGETVTHAWDAAGTYNVSVTVEDDRGATARATAVVTLTAESTDPDPIPGDDVSPTPQPDTSDAGDDASTGDADDTDTAGESTARGSNGGCQSVQTGSNAPATWVFALALGLIFTRRRTRQHT